MNAIVDQALFAATSKVRSALSASAISARVRRLGAVISGLGAVALIVAGYWGSGAFFNQYDDAYITFRYAENLATGRGLVFNAGEATDSASSFAYTVLLAALHALGFRDLPVTATVIGLACAGAIAAVTFLAVTHRTRNPVLALLLALGLALHGAVSGWAISGMETPLFSLIVLLAVFRMFVLSRLGWPEVLLLVAAALTRFEGLLLLAAAFVLGASRFVEAGHRDRRRLIVQFCAVTGALVAFLSLKYALYDTLLPHAFELKRVTTLYAPRPEALWDVWVSYAPVPVLLAAGAIPSATRRVEGQALVLYVVASIASLALGPFSDFARYSVHLLPVLVVLGSVQLAALGRLFPVVALAVGVLLVFHTSTSFATMKASNQLGAGHQACRREVGAFLQANVKPGTRVLSSDIGAIAYHAPDIAFVDAVGLTSHDVLAARKRGESQDDVLNAKRPTIIADTCTNDCLHAADFSAIPWMTRDFYWRTALPDEGYSQRLRSGRILHRCKSPDGLSFAATEFELVEPAEH